MATVQQKLLSQVSVAQDSTAKITIVGVGQVGMAATFSMMVQVWQEELSVAVGFMSGARSCFALHVEEKKKKEKKQQQNSETTQKFLFDSMWQTNWL